MEQLMENSTVNIDNRLSTVSENHNAPIGENCTHWNDPAWSGYTRSTGTVEHIHHRRTHYAIERKRDSLFKRILLALRLARPTKADSFKSNWHCGDVDTDGEMVSLQCASEGKKYSALAYIRPAHPHRPITHV